MIEAVVFDWGGTLDDGAWSDEIALEANEAGLRAIGRHDIEPADMNGWLEANESLFRLDSDDEVDLSEIVRACLGALGCRLSDEELDAFMHAWQGAVTAHAALHPGSLRLLDELRGRGLRIGLVSNAFTPGRFLLPALEASELGGRIDVVVFSADHGKRKPHPEIFEAALEELGVSAERAIFVGDRLDKDIVGARAVGMITVQATWFLAEEPGDDNAADFVAAEPGEILDIVDRCGRYPLVALVVLDGWGCAPPGPGNAVSLAETPVFDALWERYPHTTLKASGGAVGLPEGQMGNSEVGHLTIGSGRILLQDLERVNRAIESGELYDNEALVGAFERARERGGDVHLLGLVSYGGVHSHIDHLRALLELARREGMEGRVWIHAFTDGRDVSPHAAVRDLAELPAERIATVAGRYYAMDRDARWERTQKAFEAVTNPEAQCPRGVDPVAEVQRAYDEGVTDEFIEPVILEGRPRLGKDDTAIFFNFRPDRARQLTEKLLEAGYDLTTMTRYRDDFDCPVAFGEQEVTETMAQVLAEHDVRQLHVAETEKYAHVTYFFNGGREEEWGGETRILVPSPRDVGTYDERPEMSAAEVADRLTKEVGNGYGFAVVNFANPDMVGHSGVIPAVVKAVEATDRALGEVVEAVERAGGISLVTADHGNAEQLLESDGESPHTAHTTNPVPLMVTEEGLNLREGAELSDLVPTALGLLGIAKPPEMSGNSVISGLG